MICTFKLTRGAKKGAECGKTADISGLCSSHRPKGKGPARAETLETSRPSEAKPDNYKGREIVYNLDEETAQAMIDLINEYDFSNGKALAIELKNDVTYIISRLPGTSIKSIAKTYRV